jgi:hypothetical protein
MSDPVAAPTVPDYVNWLVKLLLRSRLHWLMSGSTMLLTFAGHKTGKRYVVAVRYTPGDDLITCFTDSPWWINLRNGAPVQMLIAGNTLDGAATSIDDHATVEKGLADFLTHKPRDSKYFGVRRHIDGRPDSDDIRNAAKSTAMIRVQLQS